MIGIFDSGYGGLTVFRKLDKKFPKYDFIYLGDNARSPYGDKSQKTIYQYTKEAVDWLFKEKCELIILACNTASAQALRKIQQEFLPTKYPDKKVLGVLIPVAEKIAAKNNTGKIGILATRATVESGAYPREITKLKPDAVIIQQAAPLLVPIIESAMIYHSGTEETIKTYLEPLKKENVTTLVLGCTHYPFIRHLIEAQMPRAKIFDSPSALPEALEKYLLRHPEIERKLPKNGSRRYVTTDDPKDFSNFAQNFLNLEINPEKIIL